MTLGNARVFSREAIIGAAALAAVSIFVGSASAQDQQAQENDGPLLVAGTVDCRYALRPAETAICNTPVLAAMDIQMDTLFKVLSSLVKPEVGVELANSQEIFLKEREACATDVECIGTTTAARIGDLDAVLKRLAAAGPY